MHIKRCVWLSGWHPDGPLTAIAYTALHLSIRYIKLQEGYTAFRVPAWILLGEEMRWTGYICACMCVDMHAFLSGITPEHHHSAYVSTRPQTEDKIA